MLARVFLRRFSTPYAGECLTESLITEAHRTEQRQNALLNEKETVPPGWLVLYRVFQLSRCCLFSRGDFGVTPKNSNDRRPVLVHVQSFLLRATKAAPSGTTDDVPAHVESATMRSRCLYSNGSV